MLDTTVSKFSHVKPADTDFRAEGLREFFKYRDGRGFSTARDTVCPDVAFGLSRSLFRPEGDRARRKRQHDPRFRPRSRTALLFRICGTVLNY